MDKMYSQTTIDSKKKNWNSKFKKMQTLNTTFLMMLGVREICSFQMGLAIEVLWHFGRLELRQETPCALAAT